MLINKKIILASPNFWGNVYLSKHNYALELARRGNIIYFLNPPSRQCKKRVLVEKIEDNLFVIHHKLYFPYRLKYTFPSLYFMLIRLQIVFLQRKIGKDCDIFWDFGNDLTYTLKNKKVFNNKVVISHPVDEVKDLYAQNASHIGDVFFSVSDYILQQIQADNTKKYFISHAINPFIYQYANENLLSLEKSIQSRKKGRIKVGYIGNLMFPLINFKLFKNIIKKYPYIEFNLWGGYTLDNDNNIGGSLTTEISDFIFFLKNSKNVILHGHTSQKKIFSNNSDIDIYFLCYDVDKHPAGNSHKLLEYLATGKIVVSTHLSTVSSRLNLDAIILMEKEGDENFESLFEEAVTNLDALNSRDLQKERIKYILNYTYANNLDRIEEILIDNQLI